MIYSAVTRICFLRPVAEPAHYGCRYRADEKLMGEHPLRSADRDFKFMLDRRHEQHAD